MTEWILVNCFGDSLVYLSHIIGKLCLQTITIYQSKHIPLIRKYNVIEHDRIETNGKFSYF